MTSGLNVSPLDPSLLETLRIRSWESLWKAYRSIRDETPENGKRVQWIFRGQRKADWPLQSTLERTVMAWSAGSFRQRVLNCPVPVIEFRLIREFRRRLYHYPHVAEPTDFLEWLALMRHYGAPVRLQDWTYSFWAGLHFAVKDSDGADGPCALWALDSDWVGEEAVKLLPRSRQRILRQDAQLHDEATFARVFLVKNSPPFVLPVNPRRLNERLTAQKGVFLCPGDASRSFEDNLAGVLRRARGQRKLRKLTILDTPRLRRDIRLHLDQMNISEAVLFPGLDGYARSLHHKVVDADLFLRSEATARFERRWKRSRWPLRAASTLFTR